MLSVFLGALSLFAAEFAEASHTLITPTNLKVQAGNMQLTLTWTTPSGTVTGHDVHYTSSTTIGHVGAGSRDPSTSWVKAIRSFTDTTTSQTISGLSNGVQYRVRVLGVNDHGSSSWASGTGIPRAAEVTAELSASTRTLRPEEGTAVRLTVTLDEPAPAGAGVMFIAYATGEEGSRPLPGVDFILSPTGALNATTRIPIPQGTRRAEATLSVLDDGESEGDETFEVGAHFFGGVVFEFENLEFIIPANDASTRTPPDTSVPTLSLSVSPNPVPEGSPVTLTATLSRTICCTVTFPLMVTNGTAESGDFGTLAGITINAGQTSGTGTITTNQDADEDDETFTVQLLRAQGVLPGRTLVEITIADDDGTGTPLDADTPTLSSDASLSVLEIGGALIDLRSDRDVYATRVPHGVTEVTVTPTASHPDAEITVNGNTVQSGTSLQVALDDDGETAIEIEVTAENGTTTRIYTLTVTYCPVEEREILGMFHDSTQRDIDMWENSDGWKIEDNLDDWHGVETRNGKVAVLSLPGNRLSGEVSEALKCFGGLKELLELNLSGNSGLEGELPLGLSELNNLGVLDIRCTGITVSGETEEWAMSLGEGFRNVCPDDDAPHDDMVSARGDGGCAVGASQERVGASQERVGASALLVAVLMLLALSRGLRARSS